MDQAHQRRMKKRNGRGQEDRLSQWTNHSYNGVRKNGERLRATRAGQDICIRRRNGARNRLTCIKSLTVACIHRAQMLTKKIL